MKNKQKTKYMEGIKMMHNSIFTSGHMGIAWLYQLVIFVSFFLIVWWVLKQNPKIKQDKIHTSQQSPLQILKLRLAKGEIKIKEYEELKKEIQN